MEKKEEQKVELTKVVTGTAPAFKLPDGTTVSFEDYLVWMGNKLIKIEKAYA